MRKRLPVFLLSIQAVLWLIILVQVADSTSGGECNQFPCVYPAQDLTCIDPMCPYFSEFVEFVKSRPFPLNIGIILMIPATFICAVLTMEQFDTERDTALTDAEL